MSEIVRNELQCLECGQCSYSWSANQDKKIFHEDYIENVGHYALAWIYCDHLGRALQAAVETMESITYMEQIIDTLFPGTMSRNSVV